MLGLMGLEDYGDIKNEFMALFNSSALNVSFRVWTIPMDPQYILDLLRKLNFSCILKRTTSIVRSVTGKYRASVNWISMLKTNILEPHLSSARKCPVHILDVRVRLLKSQILLRTLGLCMKGNVLYAELSILVELKTWYPGKILTAAAKTLSLKPISKIMLERPTSVVQV